MPNLTHTLMLQKFDFIWTSCRFLKVCAAKIFVEARFSGDPNYGMSDVVTQIVEIGQECEIGQELKPCQFTRICEEGEGRRCEEEESKRKERDGTLARG